MIAVTTFSQEGYQQYAKENLPTLVKHFPAKLVAYYEEKPDLEGFELRDFYSIPGFNEYQERLKRHPGTDGMGPNGYDYRYDANKFCRKVFAQDAVFDEDQYVFWVDADCFVTLNIPPGFLESLVEDVPFCYLGRKASYTETGFLGFNTKHPDFQKFRDKYLSYFTSGKILSQLKGWHDCIAFDYAREGIRGRDLTPGGYGVGNVIGESAVGKYIVHLKGSRKFSDSRKKALRV